MHEVKKYPAAKAYGYDRDTLNDQDKILHDIAISDDYSRTMNGKSMAKIVPTTDHFIEPRDYDGDPE